jgi:hypothetical protein
MGSKQHIASVPSPFKQLLCGVMYLRAHMALACLNLSKTGNRSTSLIMQGVPCFFSCSVNDTVINSPTNPLLVVNQRLQHTIAAQRKQRTAQAQSPKLMLSGVAAGTGAAGLGSPKGGSGSARATIGPLSGRSADVHSAAVVTGMRATAASPVVGGLLMSPRSVSAPSAVVK